MTGNESICTKTDLKADELTRKLDVLKQVFDHVVEMTRHEDDKAGRILAPMAFLTAAYATIYTSFLNHRVAFQVLSYDLIAVSFIMYVGCVTVGTIFILGAFGPRFNMPRPWKSKGDQTPVDSVPKSEAPKSLFFFELIAKEPEEKWAKYFSNAASVIEQKAIDDLTYEIRLISQKVSDKVRSVKRGKFFFLLAMLFLIVGTFLGVLSIILGN